MFRNIRPTNLKRAVAAEARFREALIQAGHKPAYVLWIGVNTGHSLVCANGHETSAQPANVLRGQGVCRFCARNDKADAASRFAAIVEAAGGRVTGPYVDANTPVSVVCANGHAGSPRPHHVIRGHGICAACANKVWDVFYVVAGPSLVKFGITSGDPRPRLGDHARDGMPQQLRLFTEMPEGTARKLEDQVRGELSQAGATPLRGREYFATAWTALILRVADKGLY